MIDGQRSVLRIDRLDDTRAVRDAAVRGTAPMVSMPGFMAVGEEVERVRARGRALGRPFLGPSQLKGGSGRCYEGEHGKGRQ